MLTAERLREVLDYDPETGVFLWKVPPRNQRVGQVTGTRKSDGYIRMRIDGRFYYAHRLAWLWMTGSWPANKIDHKSGMPSDNRLSNLREVSHAENLQNQRAARADNNTGLLGVCPSRGKFMAQIIVLGKNHFLGRFSTAELAYAAYLNAKRKMHPTCTI